MSYEPGKEPKGSAMHEVSDNPNQHISESEIKVFKGENELVNNTSFMDVKPKGSGFPKGSGSKEA